MDPMEESYVVPDDINVDIKLDFNLHDPSYNDFDDEIYSSKRRLPEDVSPSKILRTSNDSLKSFSSTDVTGSRIVYYDENDGWTKHGLFEGLHFMDKEQARRAMENYVVRRRFSPVWHKSENYRLVVKCRGGDEKKTFPFYLAKRKKDVAWAIKTFVVHDRDCFSVSDNSAITSSYLVRKFRPQFVFEPRRPLRKMLSSVAESCASQVSIHKLRRARLEAIRQHEQGLGLHFGNIRHFCLTFVLRKAA